MKDLNLVELEDNDLQVINGGYIDPVEPDSILDFLRWFGPWLLQS